MIHKLFNYISLTGQIEEFDEIHNNIKQGINFKGTNIWILVCAIIIASVGLNINSTAVIIGAMLISPLMGPINGMGYSIAIYDFALFRQSIKNFGFAVLASLVASTIYFAITPVSTAHSELLARTSPTIFDVLIALFGGFAGIIAISTKQKGNVIPGVAIATALMPPLCTAGYGLATGQFTFFYGAFYLFTINTVCIAYAAIAVSQMLKFPIRSTNISDIRKKSINRAIWLVLAIIILPSIYLGYRLVQEEKFKTNADNFTKNVSIYKGNYLLRSEINSQKKQIKLVYGGSSLTDVDKDSIRVKARTFLLSNAIITIDQGLSIDNLTGIKQSKSQAEETLLKQEISQLNEIIISYKNKQDSLRKKEIIGKQLLTEIKSLYPQIETCSYSDAYFYSYDSIALKEKTAVVTFSSRTAINRTEQNKIKSWLQKRLEQNDIKTYFEVKR